MLTSSNVRLESDPPALPPMVERRSSSRHRATLRPCCIIVDGAASIGLMRNFSSNGAQLEARIDAVVGDEISYYWPVRSCMRARIVWKDGNVFGLEHVAQGSAAKRARFPSRDLRVPCDVMARCWVAGKPHTVTVENISEGGLCLRDLPKLRHRSQISIEFCGVELSLATVRWQDKGCSGICLAKPFTHKELARLLTDRSFGLERPIAAANTNFDQA